MKHEVLYLLFSTEKVWMWVPEITLWACDSQPRFWYVLRNEGVREKHSDDWIPHSAILNIFIITNMYIVTSSCVDTCNNLGQ